jgi:hypothetical protein
MFSRMVQWCAGLLLGAMLAGAANATTLLPMVPAPGTNILAPGTQYLAFGVHPGSAGVAGIDTYNFLYTAAPPLAALESTTNLTIGPNGFSSLFLSWVGPGGSGVLQGPIDVIAGVTDLPLGLTIPGIYQLFLAWTLPSTGANGTYSTSVLTPDREGQNPVPLPPALILFGSALVGLGVLGRRRRQVAKI